MAKIILGAIITNIAGSVGGTTFRRSPHNITMMNKQRQQFRSAFSKNSVKNQIGAVFSSWNLLTESDRAEWSSLSKQYLFPNKFGQLVNLSGRQFYNKLNTQLIPFRLAADLDDWNDQVQGAVVNRVIGGFSINEIILEFSGNLVPGLLRVSAYQLRAGAGVKGRLKKAPFFLAQVDGETSINVFTGFQKAFPFAKVGDKFGFNIQFLNTTGFASSVQAFAVVLG